MTGHSRTGGEKRATAATAAENKNILFAVVSTNVEIFKDEVNSYILHNNAKSNRHFDSICHQ